MDNSSNRQICRFNVPLHGMLQETMGFRCSQCHQCFQYVRSLPFNIFGLTPFFLPASLSWLRQMNFLVRSSIPPHTPNLVLCIRLSKSFVLIIGKASFFASSPTLIFFGRVFMNGKTHVEYRRGLNLLFTRKALGYV